MRDGFVDVYEAMEELHIARATIFKLMKDRGIEKKKFPGDRRTYISRNNLETLKIPETRGSKTPKEDVEPYDDQHG